MTPLIPPADGTNGAGCWSASTATLILSILLTTPKGWAWLVSIGLPSVTIGFVLLRLFGVL